MGSTKRFPSLLKSCGFYAAMAVVGCSKGALVTGAHKDAGDDGAGQSGDAPPGGVGGSTASKGGSGEGGPDSFMGGAAGRDTPPLATDVADADNLGGAGGSGGVGGSQAGGTTGRGDAAAWEAGPDGSDGRPTSREAGPGRLDQRAAIDGSKPLACNGNPVLGGFPPLTQSRSPGFVAVGDVNGDGKLDLVTADYIAGTVSVLVGRGDGTLDGPSSYAAGSPVSDDGKWQAGPWSVALDDVNGDGKLDVVAANTWAGTVGVLLGKGDGSFFDVVSYPAGDGTRSGPASVALGDIDGDGHLDIATANPEVKTASVLLGKGDGTFAAKVDYATDDSPGIVLLGDLNRDGNLDLLAGRNIMLGSGDGSLVAATEAVAIYVAALADVNGDGKLDLVGGSADRTVGQVAVMLGIGDGTFTAPVTYSTGWNTWNLMVGDIDGDGRPDILSWNAQVMAVLRGAGDGTFGPGLGISMSPYDQVSIGLGDMNGDGKLDIAMTWELFGTAALSDTDKGGAADVLLGHGDGTFGRTTHPVEESLLSVDVGDVDGDGKLDVVTTGKTREGAGKLSVLTGRGDGTLMSKVSFVLSHTSDLAVRLGDVNGDGRLDIAAASDDMTTVTVLTAAGDGSFTTVTSDIGAHPCSSCGMLLGDVNGDGKVDLVTVRSDSATASASAAILLGRGDGSFAVQSTFAVCDTENPSVIALADVDGDGWLDMVIDCKQIRVLFGNGDGTFTAPIGVLGDMDGFFSSAAVGDMNGDGKLDLVAFGGGYTSSVEVALGNGDGTFAAPAEVAVPWEVISIGLTDINGDGKLDVVTRDVSSGQPNVRLAITFLLGNGDGTLAPGIDYPIDVGEGLAFGDMNGDGRQDIVTLTHSNTVDVLFGSCR